MKYTCAMCHETFGAGITEEEALEQLAKEFPSASVEECLPVCDVCFQANREEFERMEAENTQ